MTANIALADVVAKLDRQISTVFGVDYPIQAAQAPATTLLRVVLGRNRGPVSRRPVPATDGVTIWLPADMSVADRDVAIKLYRTMALQQAARARRGSVELTALRMTPLHRDLCLLVEAAAADEELVQLLPDMAGPINELRDAALGARPLMSAFPLYARPLENFVRILLRCDCRIPADRTLKSKTPTDTLRVAEDIAASMLPATTVLRARKMHLLVKDWWTGDLRRPPAGMPPLHQPHGGE